ncbi:type II secretion system major pseudopilin GspG [Arenimonas sp.]|uniref:type II secretion system major pseudopilin GspG n=1 Tax=Arenimonas sp. TaxID=1872635 RepID=UPI0039E36501
MNTFRYAPHRRAQAGFTLLEIVIVIGLIGLILAFVASRIMGSQKQAEYRLAKAQMQTIAGKVEQFRSDVGRWPASLDELVSAPSNGAGWLGPYSRAEELNDPWHRKIELRQPGENGQEFQLISLGADGKQGGEGVDADLVVP